jgi:hypothetical protein
MLRGTEKGFFSELFMFLLDSLEIANVLKVKHNNCGESKESSQ